MALTPREIDELIKAVAMTRPEELTCDECLKLLAEFAERALEGKSIPDGLRAIEHHLDICGECREEYEALLETLRPED